MVNFGPQVLGACYRKGKHRKDFDSDKNNHLHIHRQQLRDAVKGLHPPVRLLALNWSLDLPHMEIHRICADCILARGANHQTLHGNEHGKAHESTIWQFLHTTKPLADDEADTMDVREDLEQALSRAVDALVHVLDIPHPNADTNAEQIGAALGKARRYRPALTDAQKWPQKKKGSTPPWYFAIPAEIDLIDILDTQIARTGARKFWDTLKVCNAVARRPHITFVHSKQLLGYTDLWECYAALYALSAPLLFRAWLGHIIFNAHIMAATVEELCVDDSEADEAQVGSAFVSQLDCHGLCPTSICLDSYASR